MAAASVWVSVSMDGSTLDRSSKQARFVRAAAGKAGQCNQLRPLFCFV